jgi:hypothetical protein
LYSFAFLPAGKRRTRVGSVLGLDGVWFSREATLFLRLGPWDLIVARCPALIPAKVNAEFFPDGKWKANFLGNLGYGDRSKPFPRNPRLEFDEACRVL